MTRKQVALLAALALIAFSLVGCGPVRLLGGGYARPATITVANGSGQHICSVYITDDADEWGNNRLESGEVFIRDTVHSFTVPAGQSLYVRVDDCENNPLGTVEVQALDVYQTFSWRIEA